MPNYKIVDADSLDSGLSAIASAIRTKGGTSASLAFPSGFAQAVNDIPSGGGSGSVPEKDVNFYDYDGICVASYTAAEFANLTAIPANPDHSGDDIPLTSQGWNWSLSDAQTYVAKYGRLKIGQMYVTTDGKTHVLIHLEEGRTSPMLGCCPNGTVDVDWGDGTAHDTLTGTSITTAKWTQTHNYATPGDYVIKLTVTGSMEFYGSNSSNQYAAILRYTNSGDSRNRAYLNAVRSVHVGSGVTSVGSNAFHSCSNLASITIPDGVTSIGSSAFQNCYSLPSITIPDSVTSIVGSAFNSCSSFTSISIPDGVTSIGSSAFQNCYSLPSITIPDGVTSISSSAFQYCHSLASITIPDGVTSISGGAFQYCHSLAALHFLPATPPSVTSSSAFGSLPADCKIYVPTGSLSAYTSATNYPSSSTYTYIEE